MFPLETQAPIVQLLPMRIQMGDARPLHLDTLGMRRGTGIELVPSLLPRLMVPFNSGERLGRGCLDALRLDELRFAGGERFVQGIDLGTIVLHVRPLLVPGLFHRLQVLLLLGTHLPGVLDRLLDPRDLRAQAVIISLNPVETVVGLDMGVALPLDVGLDCPQRRDLCLEFILTCRHLALAGTGLLVERAPAQREQFRAAAAFLLLDLFVPLGGPRLALQRLQALLEFDDQVVDATDVLLGVANAIFGFAATFLIFGNASGLFQEDPQLLGLRLDQARDRALFDDRVAARSESGPEKDVGDVATATARAIEEIDGLSVA